MSNKRNRNRPHARGRPDPISPSVSAPLGGSVGLPPARDARDKIADSVLAAIKTACEGSGFVAGGQDAGILCNAAITTVCVALGFDVAAKIEPVPGSDHFRPISVIVPRSKTSG